VSVRIDVDNRIGAHSFDSEGVHMGDGAIDPRSFGASFQTFMERMAAQTPTEEPEFRRRLREHFGTDPAALPVVGERFAMHEHVNLHLALESVLAAPEWAVEVLGVISPVPMMGVQLAQLATTAAGPRMGGATVGPVEYVNLPLDQDGVVACVRSGLFLARHGDERLVVLVGGPRGGYRDALTVEVMAPGRTAAEAALARVRSAMRQRNVYRGRVISLDSTQTGELTVQFHRLPKIQRNDIVLPEGLLARIERQAVRFAQLRDELLAMGRHLKRGLLLHGPPGTGKTLTAMYLAGQMPDRTVLLLTGRGLGLVAHSCSLARLLEPATVIIEDVDLIAEERTSRGGCNALLFELLNQMDGIAEDADVLFVLTTNRPDLLEPALASRPGRIDQAIEVPLPDAACRVRLLELYGRGLELRLARRDAVIARTEGVSAAFLRELLRKAALAAADEGAGRVVEDRHLEEALRELVVEGGPLTRSLLGFGAVRQDRPEGC
jgi:hypothetical protein